MITKQNLTDRSTRLPLIAQTHQSPAKIQNIALNKLQVYDLNPSTRETNTITGTVQSPTERSRNNNWSISKDQSMSKKVNSDQDIASLIGTLHQHKYPVDKSFEYIKPTSFHSIPEMKRLVAVDRLIIADVTANKNQSPQNTEEEERPRRKYGDMESVNSETQTTFLTGSGGVRIDKDVSQTLNFTILNQSITPKALSHIKDQSCWNSKGAQNTLQVQSPISKQHQTLQSLEMFNIKHQPKNIYTQARPKVGELITRNTVNVKYYSTPTISLNGRFLKSVGDCGIKITQKDVQLLKPPVGNSYGLDKFKQIRCIQRDIFMADNFGKREPKKLLKFKQSDLDNPNLHRTKQKVKSKNSETESLVESDIPDSDCDQRDEPTKISSTHSQRIPKVKPQDQYQLFTGSRKAFEDSIERAVAQRLPEYNIVQVNDEFYNRLEDINVKNLRLKKSVINLENYGVNTAFDDNQPPRTNFELFTLAQIDVAFAKYEKNRERYLKSYRMLQRFMNSSTNAEHKKEQEKQNEIKRRDSHVIAMFQRQCTMAGETRLSDALADPVFVALLKLRDTYEERIKNGYQEPRMAPPELTDEHATMMLMKQLLTELGQVITSPQPAKALEGEEAENYEINSQKVTKYAKQAGDNLVSKILNGVPPDSPKRQLGQKKQRQLTSLIQSPDLQDSIKSVVTQLIGNSEQVQVASQSIQSEEFYRIAKEAVVSASAKEDFTYKIVKNMDDKLVPAMPIYSKIQQGILNLIGYRIVPGQAKALATYILEQSNDSLIKSITLHNNGFREEEFSLIIQGLANKEPQTKAQDYLQQLTYSHNEFGERSCESLAKICSRSYPNSLKTLVLNGLIFKQQGLMSKICKAIIPADQLLKLVFKDMVFDGAAATNLCQHLSTAFTLQDLQLVNCKFAPQHLAAIAKTLLTSPSLSTLTNFSLKQNVLRKHSSNKDFISDLAKFVQECHNLVHLDLSEMNLTLLAATQVLQESVYKTQRLACVHIGYMGGDLPLKTKDQDEGCQEVQNRDDFGEVLAQNQEQILKNLVGLLECAPNVSVLDAESNMHRAILDFKETQTDARIQEQTNAVIFRLSNRPDLFKTDMVEELFKDCDWQKTDNGQCWVCNGHQLMLKELKRQKINGKNVMKLI